MIDANEPVMKVNDITPISIMNIETVLSRVLWPDISPYPTVVIVVMMK